MHCFFFQLSLLGYMIYNNLISSRCLGYSPITLMFWLLFFERNGCDLLYSSAIPGSSASSPNGPKKDPVGNELAQKRALLEQSLECNTRGFSWSGREVDIMITYLEYQKPR